MTYTERKEIKEVTVREWIASDGKKFDSEIACIQYEDTLRRKEDFEEYIQTKLHGCFVQNFDENEFIIKNDCTFIENYADLDALGNFLVGYRGANRQRVNNALSETRKAELIGHWVTWYLDFSYDCDIVTIWTLDEEFENVHKHIVDLQCAESSIRHWLLKSKDETDLETSTPNQSGDVENSTYNMPEEHKTAILCRIEEFRREFFTHLNEIFPEGWRYPEEDGGYISVDSTRGWYTALEATFIALGMDDILEYYQSLEWYESDSFDWEIEKMVDERDE